MSGFGVSKFKIRFSGSQRADSGPSAKVLQLGNAIFQIIAPKGTYQEDAYDARQQFVDLFRDWRSPDGKLMVLGFNDYKNEVSANTGTGQPGYLQLNVQFNWRSYRPTNS